MAPSVLETESIAQVSSSKAELAAPPKDTTHEEYQYLDLIREILDTGEHRPDR